MIFHWPNDMVLFHHFNGSRTNGIFPGTLVHSHVLHEFQHYTTMFHAQGTVLSFSAGRHYLGQKSTHDILSNAEAVECFLRWLYSKHLSNGHKYPGIKALIMLGRVALDVTCPQLFDDVLDAIEACGELSSPTIYEWAVANCSSGYHEPLLKYVAHRATANSIPPTVLTSCILWPDSECLDRDGTLRQWGNKPFSFSWMLDSIIAVIDMPVFNFLQLPLEIRNMIYSYVLVAGVPLKPGKEKFRTPCDKSCTSLLQVNKQISLEARPVFYTNDFQIDPLYGAELLPIINSVGNELTINVHPSVHWKRGVLETLVTSSRLKKLHLRFYLPSGLFGATPSDDHAEVLQPMKSGLGRDYVKYISANAPFYEHLIRLPGFDQILQLRGLTHITCEFSPSFLRTKRYDIQKYLTRELTQPRIIGPILIKAPDPQYARVHEHPTRHYPAFGDGTQVLWCDL
ncbi:hypothetical protein HYALB_00011223 [Hymenoscyphus albidus]|uniref:Uncharacterized protein n=1 Tax=Hymenoscyphus albidus TaxID=595503 RepID=A0A9N9Q3G1_9HELO|nr:hypothetical protein HYALB_00011223 [Hymenoscyphus albidus]